jgi:protein-disulfide isomerase
MPMKPKEIIEVILPKDIFVGNVNAPVTLVEFGEYENEECAKANEVVKKLMAEFEDKMKFNFRHFPQTKIHQRSMKAGEASVGASQEGKFWEMHNILFQNRRQLGTTSLKIYSKEAGVNNKLFLNQLVDSMYGSYVMNDLVEGIDRGVKKVPTFFINDEEYTGKITFEEMRKAIEAVLKKPKKKSLTKQRA